MVKTQCKIIFCMYNIIDYFLFLLNVSDNKNLLENLIYGKILKRINKLCKNVLFKYLLF